MKTYQDFAGIRLSNDPLARPRVTVGGNSTRATKLTVYHIRDVVEVIYSLRTGSVSSVAQSCPTLCDPMNHSMPALPVHHQFPEIIQTHVHRVGDAIQLSHPLSSPPAPNPSQHQGLLQ